MRQSTSAQQKSILITGGTGFLGRALVADWLEQGHQICVLSRNQAAATRLLGPVTTVASELNKLSKDAHFDAVVNLAGEPIFGKRWSYIQKQRLRDSRIALTEQLVSYLETLTVKPDVLISGSAVGFYGSQGDILLTENSIGNSSFSQRLCADWEHAAREAETLGIRVCLVRTAPVLDIGGGILQRMLPAFRLGLGGRLGDGRQWMPWIHRRDWLAIVHTLIANPDMQGAYNATAPTPVTNQTFSECLARHLDRSAHFPMPATVLKLLFGEMSELMLDSQRVIPERLLTEGFTFQFPTLDEALLQILSRD